MSEATDIKLAKNIIIADLDYVNEVAKNLRQHFSEVIGRDIPKADLAKWLEYVALDAEFTPGDEEFMVIAIHRKTTKRLSTFTPSDIADDISGKAFKGPLGEFQMSALAIEDGVTNAEDFFLSLLEVAHNNKQVEHLILLPDSESYLTSVTEFLTKHNRPSDAGSYKHITLFTMVPTMLAEAKVQILGYSIMAALGIRPEEI